MNLLILAGLALCGILLLWAAQSVALALAGEPQAWPLRSRSEVCGVKWTRRISVQLIWAILLLAFPWATDSNPVAFFARVFPRPDWIAIGGVFATCLALMGLAILIELLAGWIQWEPQHTTPVRRAKLLRRLLTPIPLAIVEEAVFRGVLLEQIAQALPSSRAGVATAIIASAAIFSALHFVRPDDERPLWQPAAGLFLFGVLCGAAYVTQGHTLWMPVAIHATGILAAETTRLYTVYRGPKLLIGYSCFPHCGLVGFTTLALLAVVLFRPF